MRVNVFALTASLAKTVRLRNLIALIEEFFLRLIRHVSAIKDITESTANLLPVLKIVIITVSASQMAYVYAIMDTLDPVAEKVLISFNKNPVLIIVLIEANALMDYVYVMINTKEETARLGNAKMTVVAMVNAHTRL